MDGEAKRERVCGNCRAFQAPPQQHELGECRRRTPSEYSGSSVGHFPLIDATDWCCEWLPIEAPR